jgi:hypothetical protein
MSSYLLHPTITVLQQSDGSFAALGRELPIFVVAPTVDELWDRIARLQPSIERMLTLSSDGDVEGYLRERNVRFEIIREAEGTGSAVEVPLLVRVAAS